MKDWARRISRLERISGAMSVAWIKAATDDQLLAIAAAGPPIDIDFSRLTDDELNQIIEGKGIERWIKK